MKRFAETCLQYLGYLGYRAICGVASLLSVSACLRLGSAGGRMVWALAPSYRRLARRNLRVALDDEHDERWIREITRRQFESLGRNFLVSLKLSSSSPDEAESLVTYVGHEHIEAAAAKGRGLIAAISHLGPWELYSQLPSLGPGVAPATMYRPLENRFINAHVVRQRSRIGVALFDKTTGVYGPLKHLRAGGGIGILIDQHAGDLGIWSPFFRRLASTTNLPALLSLRTGAPVVSISLLPDGPSRWKVIYQPPHFPPEKPSDFAAEAARITHALNAELEAAIRQAPEEWFWLHNRWKTPKPAFLLGQNKRGFFLPEGETKKLKPFRILLRSPNPLGDACMAMPAVRAIKASRPDCHLTVLCRENLEPIWKTCDAVDAILTTPKSASPWETGNLIRRQPAFDAVILLPGSLRAAIEAWRGKIPRIAGFRGHHRSWLVDQVVPPPAPGPPRHHAHGYLHLAEQCGCDIATESAGVDFPTPISRPAPHGDPLHL
ncbi:MAG: hypothetical protein KDL87_15000, partial [Verrucomicrobiae bacterium]|nr:hypothetical protein [Verrucomicrobiae bacterium]